MPSKAFLLIDRGWTDRYRFTRMHQDTTIKPGTLRYGVWTPPVIPVEDTDIRHTVTAKDVGHMDLIAFIYYKNEKLWWVIAWVNRICNPVTDMYIGQQLIIPDITKVTSILSSEVRK